MWKEFWYTHFADLSMDVADLFEDLRQQRARRVQERRQSSGGTCVIL